MYTEQASSRQSHRILPELDRHARFTGSRQSENRSKPRHPSRGDNHRITSGISRSRAQEDDLVLPALATADQVVVSRRESREIAQVILIFLFTK